MLQLFVNDRKMSPPLTPEEIAYRTNGGSEMPPMEIDNPSIRLRWCIDAETLRGLEKAAPLDDHQHFMLIVVASEKGENRIIVPLEQGMEIVPLQPGKNTISAVPIYDKKPGKEPHLIPRLQMRENYEWAENIQVAGRIAKEYLKQMPGKHGGYARPQVTMINAWYDLVNVANVELEVPRELFADPPAWMKRWVYLILSRGPYEDQCDFRHKALFFAFTIQPILLLVGLILSAAISTVITIGIAIWLLITLRGWKGFTPRLWGFTDVEGGPIKCMAGEALKRQSPWQKMWEKMWDTISHKLSKPSRSNGMLLLGLMTVSIAMIPMTIVISGHFLQEGISSGGSLKSLQFLGSAGLIILSIYLATRIGTIGKLWQRRYDLKMTADKNAEHALLHRKPRNKKEARLQKKLKAKHEAQQEAAERKEKIEQQRAVAEAEAKRKAEEKARAAWEKKHRAVVCEHAHEPLPISAVPGVTRQAVLTFQVIKRRICRPLA